MLAAIRGRLTDWQGGLERDPAQARQVLRKFLVGRLAFHPSQDAAGAWWYEFRGDTIYAKLTLWNEHPMQAAIMLRGAVQLDQRPAQPWFHLGIALQASGALDRAQEAYAEAVTRDPQNAEYRHAAVAMARLLAEHAQKQGRSADAARLLWQADLWEKAPR